MSEPPAKTALFGSKDTIFISNMQPQKTYFTTYLHAILAILLQYAHVATKDTPEAPPECPATFVYCVSITRHTYL